MVSLKLQKRLAASVMKCGKGKVWLDPNESSDISMANSRMFSFPSFYRLWFLTRVYFVLCLSATVVEIRSAMLNHSVLFRSANLKLVDVAATYFPCSKPCGAVILWFLLVHVLSIWSRESN